MSGRIAVTGATGFLGSRVVPRLADRCDSIVCVARPTSDTSQLRPLPLEVRTADLGDRAGLLMALEGAEVLVNLASLGFGHAPGIVSAAREAGIQRAIFIGTTAIFTSLPARTRAVRIQAEACVRSSGLVYTLLRPTMIYGTRRDRNVARLVRYVARYPVLLVPGSGRAMQQPVFVDDVADAVVAALERPEQTACKSYNLAGPRPLSFNEVVDTAARVLGRRLLRVHMPMAPAVLALRVAGLLPVPLPVRAEQLARLEEDKAFDIDAARTGLGFQPMEFEDGVRRQVAEMFDHA